MFKIEIEEIGKFGELYFSKFLNLFFLHGVQLWLFKLRLFNLTELIV